MARRSLCRGALVRLCADHTSASDQEHSTMRRFSGARALPAARAVAVALATLVLAPAAPRAAPQRAAPERAAPALEARDPLVPMLRRVDRYLQRSETPDGVALDWRWVINETEAVRLSV